MKCVNAVHISSPLNCVSIPFACIFLIGLFLFLTDFWYSCFLNVMLCELHKGAWLGLNLIYNV